jgi:murein DD-endopeptidase MepM/ murein hydrolase activator NlpD
VSIIAGTGSSAGAEDGEDDAARRAADEIAAAQDRANQAAADLFQAELDFEDLADRGEQLEAETRTLEQQVGSLKAQVEQVAIHRFAASGATAIPLLTDARDPNDRLQADVLAAVATNASAVTMDDYEVAQRELAEHQAEVEANQEALREQQEVLRQMQAAAEAEVERLREVEAQRLENERIQAELAARRAEEQRRRDAEAAARAEAERQAAQTVAAAAPSQPVAAIVGEGAQPTVPSAGAAAPPAAADASGPPAPSPSPPPSATPTPTAAPAPMPAAPEPSRGQPAPAPPPATAPPTAPPTTPAPRVTAPPTAAPAPPPAPAPRPTSPPPPREPEPAPEPAPAPSGGGMVCPVRGSSAYSDTWGAARSGGRSHLGVDMLAPTGTPLVAVVSGSVQFKQTSLGGNSVWLNGNNGTRYFYAHLDRFSGSSRGVSQGELIGYIGDTGNARGTPHLHFEVHPGGGAAVNPYPYVVRAGC